VYVGAGRRRGRDDHGRTGGDPQDRAEPARRPGRQDGSRLADRRSLPRAPSRDPRHRAAWSGPRAGAAMPRLAGTGSGRASERSVQVAVRVPIGELAGGPTTRMAGPWYESRGLIPGRRAGVGPIHSLCLVDLVAEVSALAETAVPTRLDRGLCRPRGVRFAESREDGTAVRRSHERAPPANWSARRQRPYRMIRSMHGSTTRDQLSDQPGDLRPRQESCSEGSCLATGCKLAVAEPHEWHAWHQCPRQESNLRQHGLGIALDYCS